MKVEPQFRLSEQEIHSPLWMRLTEHYSKRLASLRARNDNDLTEADTAKLRGRIREVQVLLALANPAPAIVVADDIE